MKKKRKPLRHDNIVPKKSAISPSVEPSERSPRQIGARFRALLKRGATLLPQGTLKRNPRALLSLGYTPRYALELFGNEIYLTNVRQNDDIRFFVAYVWLGSKPHQVHPRIFYKDVSLTWRSASHFVRSDEENWIGKGDVHAVMVGGVEHVESDESTTDLPLEIQSALDVLCRRTSRIRYDDDAVRLILRRGHDNRIRPFADFSGPRRRAAAEPAKHINRGRPFARFTRKQDPTSLVIVDGFEPDFARGLAERHSLTSSLYGGRVWQYRIASRNRRVQYLFCAAPRHCWIGSVQGTEPEISSYAVRLVDAVTDEALLLPGFEYHFIDQDEQPPTLHSQIPPGYAGAQSKVDPSRADASAWLDRIPVLQKFRKARTRLDRR